MTNVDETSKTRMVLSRLALTMNWSPGMKRADDTVWSCPAIVLTFFQSFWVSHTLINRSDEQVT